MSRRVRKWCIRSGAGLLVLGVLLVVRIYWGRAVETIHVGYETTRIMGPLRADGTVDYYAAFNAEMSAGVTNENNAYVLVRQILGKSEYREWFDEACEKQFGFPPIPAPGKQMFLYYSEWLRKHRPATGSAEEADNRQRASTTRPWDSAADPILAAWVADCEPAIELAIEASRRSRWFQPFVLRNPDDSLFETQVANITAIREVTDALLNRAMLRLRQGRLLDSDQDILAVYRLGSLYMQSLEPFAYLNGMSMIGRASQADAALVDCGLTESQAARFLKERTELGPLPESWRLDDIHNRYVALDLITQTKRFGPDHDGPRKPAGPFAFGIMPLRFDPVLRETNEWFDQLAAAGKQPTHAARQAAYDRIGAEAAARRADLESRSDSPSVIRRFTVLFVRDDPGSIPSLRDAAIAQCGMAQIGFLLADFKARSGKYPASLAELDDLKLPKDPFVDGPFVYRTVENGFLLYSVGPNLRDDGGRLDPAPRRSASFMEKPPPREHDDLVFRVEK